MKQHITLEQNRELSEKGLDNLISWWVETYGSKDITLLSIGQLIQFLDEHLQEPLLEIIRSIHWDGWGIEYDREEITSTHKELIDALWEAVVSILNKED